MVYSVNLIIQIVKMNFYIIKSNGFELLTDVISNCSEQQDIIQILDIYDKISSNSIYRILYKIIYRCNC